MSRLRKLRYWPQLRFAFAVFITMLVLVYIFRDMLRETLLAYILNLLWTANAVLQSFDQRCIWILGLLIALVITIILSLQNYQIFIPDAEETRSEPSLFQHRIRFWRTEINVMSSDVSSHSPRPSDLRRLVNLVLASRAQADIKEINQLIRDRKLQVPIEVSYVLGIESPEVRVNHQPGFINRLIRILQRKWRISQVSSHSPDPGFDKVAAYLESLLEDNYDN